MIRLSRISDYGIVLMAHLAGLEDDQPHNAREIARAAGLPLPVVSKILKGLAREGLLISHRGVKGGYGLARPPHEITAEEMISALEGPIGLTECAVRPGECAQEPSCGVREPWQRINAVVRAALTGVTLADLAQPPCEVGPPNTLPLSPMGAD